MGLGKVTTGLMILAGLAATVVGCNEKISVKADFNGDGIRDTLMAESHGIYLDMGRELPRKVLTLKHTPQYLGAEDFDGDGNTDITYRVFEGSGMVNGDGTYVLVGNGDGTFQAAVKIGSQPRLYQDLRR
jgi:hypothetical protein